MMRISRDWTALVPEQYGRSSQTPVTCIAGLRAVTECTGSAVVHGRRHRCNEVALAAPAGEQERRYRHRAGPFVTAFFRESSTSRGSCAYAKGPRSRCGVGAGEYAVGE